MAAYNETMSTSNLPTEAQQSSTVPERLLRLFALYENLLRFVMPACSSMARPNEDTPIVTSTNIVDVSGVGLKQFWNLKGHMQDASVLATAHYPETLDRIFVRPPPLPPVSRLRFCIFCVFSANAQQIVGAPSFFPTVWSWIKRWFDPVTTSKIFILSAAEVKPTLHSFMDPSSIPTQYGGDLEWKWGDMPNLDDEAKRVIGGVASGSADGGYLKGPMTFQGDKIEVLGRENGEGRRREIPVEQGSQAAQTQEKSQENGAGEKTGNGDATAATAPSQEQTVAA